MQQMSFALAEHQGKKRITKREKCLAEMQQIVPWQRLRDLIEPYYPKGQRGRPPIGLSRMLRLYFVQQWYGLADEALEDAVSDSAAIRAFVGIDLGAPIRSQTHFRHTPNSLSPWLTQNTRAGQEGEHMKNPTRSERSLRKSRTCSLLNQGVFPVC